MMKKRICILAAALAALAALSLTGCMKYDPNMDYSVTVRNVLLNGAGGGNSPTLPGLNDTPAGTYYDVNKPLEINTEPDTQQSGEDAPGVVEPSAPAAMTPAQYVQTLGTTEYDILRSNNFTMTAAFREGNTTSPVSMAKSGDQVYVTSEVDGLQLGVYVTGKKMFIYLPTQQKYLEMNSAVAKAMKMDPEEFVNMANDMGFDKMPPLSAAESMTDGTVNGVKCKIFYIKSGDGNESMRIYLAGTKLLAMENLDAAGNVKSSILFNSVQAGFPQMPPAGFTKMSYLEFAKQIMNQMS